MKNKELIEETMLIISERLKRLNKVTVGKIKNYDTYDMKGSLDFYIGGDEYKHLYNCWFGYSDVDQLIELRCKPPSDSDELKGIRFQKTELTKRVNREVLTFWITSNILEDFGTEEEFKEYFSDKLGFSLPFSKCFSVVRSDGKPYTGAKGEKPIVIYHPKYMNQFNGDYCMEQLKNLTKVVRKKCNELGFTPRGGRGFVNVDGDEKVVQT